MTVAKVIEISSSSPNSFDEAVARGIEKASKTVKNIKSAWVKDMIAEVEGGKVTSYRVHMKVTFILAD
ncbi:MAG: dodecin domain-containing protein [Gemmatimonadales bacterium]|nr:MAG: dodecin domain-containing protein [Gemmatimonadales bacterium]